MGGYGGLNTKKSCFEFHFPLYFSRIKFCAFLQSVFYVQPVPFEELLGVKISFLSLLSLRHGVSSGFAFFFLLFFFLILHMYLFFLIFFDGAQPRKAEEVLTSYSM